MDSPQTPPCLCPACRQPMRVFDLPKRTTGTIQLDLCFNCQGLWSDAYETFQITPGGIIDLFKLIHVHRDDPRQPLPAKLSCPRCSDPLIPVKDVGRSGHFNYHRCLQQHGRFVAFSQFMIEKGFVRQLSQAEVKTLAVSIGTIRCSGCGAPVDIRNESACSHCGAPIAILDETAVSRALASYQQEEKQRTARNPEAIADALIAIERQRSEQQADRILDDARQQRELGDLVLGGVGLVCRWLAR